VGKIQHPAISVFALGGTIASAAQTGKEGARVSLTGKDLLAAVPGLDSIANLTVQSFRQVPSGDLTMQDALELVAAIQLEIVRGAQGIVVTQGTDTLEEMAFVLDLLLPSELPIVLTGAMRNSSLPGSDGPANILGAVRVAASAEAHGYGALVVFNDEIHAARFVRKRHTTSTATFGSPLTGPVGYVIEGRVRMLLRLPGRMLIELAPQPEPARVALIPIVFDDDGSLLSDAATAPYQGAVVAAFGAGHVPARLAPMLKHLNERVPVVVASRTFAGDLLHQTYAYPGGEMDLLSRRLIFADAYDAVHARVLLQLLLMAGASRTTIAKAFDAGLSARGAIVVSAESISWGGVVQ
jgi:L-asparaginase